MRILITSVGGTLTPLLIKHLKNDKQLKGIYVVGIDKRNLKPKDLLLDKFYKISTANSKNYIRRILNISIKEKINLIVPYSDNEAFKISKNIAFFKKNKISVMVNNYSTIKKIINKEKTFNILKKNNVYLPKFKIVKNVSELKKNFIFFDYPLKSLILKPVKGIGGRGVIILKGKKDKIQSWVGKGKREKIFNPNKTYLTKKLFKYGSLMMMEVLKKPVYDVDNLSFNHKHISIIRKRINPNGIPYKGNILSKNNKIISYCKKITKILNLKFLTDIDLITDKFNNPCLLEINPRPSGSIATNYLAQIPLFSYAIALCLNKKYKFRLNLKTKRLPIK